MRLTCPNCSAQYEVPDDVIPEGGRDVQCSNCDQTWFQAKEPEAETSPEAGTEHVSATDSPTSEVPEVTPEPTPEPAESSSNVDPSVANILREEAEREAELRAKEGVSLESQPDFALDPPVEPKVEPRTPTATETATDAGQKDVLPDVEAINSGLRSDDIATEATVAAQRKSGGFMRGFALIVIIGVVLILIYGNAKQISETVPQAEPVLQSYVSLIDQARLWLEAQASGGQ